MVSYTLDEKAQIIALLHRFEGVNVRAMNAITETFGFCPSRRSLYTWLREVPLPQSLDNSSQHTTRKRITPERLEQAQLKLDEKFEIVANTCLDRLLRPEILAEMKGRDLAWVAAVSVDKLRLLRDMPTEIVGILADIVPKLRDRGLNPVAVFSELSAQIDQIQNEVVLN